MNCSYDKETIETMTDVDPVAVPRLIAGFLVHVLPSDHGNRKQALI